jgi:hypothetical protein
MITPEQLAMFRRLRFEGATALEASTVIMQGVAIELAATQLRDSHGRFASRGDLAAHIKAHDTASLHAHETASRDAKAKIAADRAKRAQQVYTPKRHRYVAGSVTIHHGDLAGQRRRAASVTAAQRRAMQIARQTPVTQADLGKAVVDGKLYTAAEFAEMQRQLDELKREMDKEDDEQSRATLSSHIALIIVGILIAAAIGGMGLPALLAAGATATPQIAQEISDFHVVEQGRGREWFAHPVKEAQHAARGLKQQRQQRQHSPKSS